MKIGILTITPNIGFGGIMQTYALKNVLEELNDNNTVCVISYKRKYKIKSKVYFFVKMLFRHFFYGQFTKFTIASDYNYSSQNTQSFINKYLNSTKNIYSEKKLRRFINDNLNILVIGSDQVWRPKYVWGIKNYFAEGINPSIKKIAYAASLGVGVWEYDIKETKVCKNLIRNFSYISVREQNAIQLIKDNLEYSNAIYWDLDPTLLISPLAYSKFIRKKANNEKYLFTYILDVNISKKTIADKIAERQGLSIYAFNTNAENARLPLNERVAPPVEEWLSRIANSDYVITDSFHGTVFSIIFNKPFLVYVNQERGAERFVSILTMLGLESRMIYCKNDYHDELIDHTIDWAKINMIISSKREEIISRLKYHLK